MYLNEDKKNQQQLVVSTRGAYSLRSENMMKILVFVLRSRSEVLETKMRAVTNSLESRQDPKNVFQ